MEVSKQCMYIKSFAEEQCVIHIALKTERQNFLMTKTTKPHF